MSSFDILTAIFTSRSASGWKFKQRKNIDRVTTSPVNSQYNFWEEVRNSCFEQIIKTVTRNGSEWANRMTVDKRFSVVDYVVFSVMLLLSALIGIWYGCGGGKQITTAEYLLGDRQMKSWPIAISILVSFLSAISLLGLPGEIYTYGTQFYVVILSYVLTCAATSIVYIPMFRRIKITSVNEVRKSTAFVAIVRLKTFKERQKWQKFNLKKVAQKLRKNEFVSIEGNGQVFLL